MIVYSQKTTPRIVFTFNHLLESILGLEFVYTDDEEFFSNYDDGIKLSYGKEFGQNEIFIPQISNILFEENCSQDSFDDFLKNIKQDPIGLAFVLLSRYQEYLPYKADSHGRFPFSEDKVFQLLNVETACVDEFALELKNKILEKNPYFNFKEKKAKTICTIDVDRAYKYKGSSKWELMLKMKKYQLYQDEENLNSLKSYLKTGKDRYDTYDYINAVCANYNVGNQYFILLANHKSKYDNNLNCNNKAQQKLLQSLASKYAMGLHPSYQSNSDEKIIEREKINLEHIIQKTVDASRQHYIRMSLPKTYQSLLQLQFAQDYSMGFPEQIGFRAGTSFPFYWFDLEHNHITDLQLFPFCAMDVTLRKYLNLSPESAIHKINELKEKIKNYGGNFIPIFHNQNLTDTGYWSDWRKVFEAAMKP